MERPQTSVSPSEETSSEAIGRRQLLKALAATGGAFAAFLLPGQWSKPVVEAGELAAHAQASPTPIEPTQEPGPTEEPTRYIALCDSTPGGGNIALTPTITNIRPYIQLASGSGSLGGVETTMTVNVIEGSPSFSYGFPQYSTTDSSGRASFPDLGVSATNGDRFRLIFSFAVVNGPAIADCGEFYYNLN